MRAGTQQRRPKHVTMEAVKQKPTRINRRHARWIWGESEAMAIFKKKSKTQNLEPELATLRQRVQALETKRQAAEAELTAATEARQLNLIEGSLDDTKTAHMLQDRVNIAASAIVGFEDAISVVQVQIAEIERKLDAERTQAARTAAADTLARDLDSIEKALPLYLD